MGFRAVDPRVSFPRLEVAVEAWWKENDVGKRWLASGDRSRPFVFFEGPPTANGRPGVHHVEARVAKDIVNRFWRMRGHYIVGARGGWDTHGLPVEVEVEKELGFKGKADIEKYGITEFNARCRESVNRYVDEFERLTERIAFWLDLDNPYWTYSNAYIESLWWVLQQLWERDLLFRDYKVAMHCPRCGTSLSDHEVAQGFEDDVDDPSVWVKFSVAPSDHPLSDRLAGAVFLAWTTTPWTLPANAALAVKPDATYVLAEQDGTRYLLAETLVEQVLGENTSVVERFAGSQLVGLLYENLFQGVPGPGDTVDWNTAYRVVADDFVSLDDGTGVVHIAPAYGDLEIGRKYGLPTLFSVDLAGNVMPEFNDLGFGGMFFKQADPLITQNLQQRGLLLKSGRVRHSYPFCWRCGTPLLYYAKRSWYIRTTAKKDRLLAHNQAINWVPEHIKNGRFGNWLENNIDWALSRERYWGTPLPIWVSDDGEYVEVIGSVAELEEKVGRSLKDLDLHRPFVDELTWQAPAGHGTMRRVPDVADAWFDSGSMPVAQWHYPFENQDVFAIAGQADFISEAIDQTRGWFYTLHAVSTLLFDRPVFKNVICLGHILDITGEKMSKSRGNVVDPFLLVEQYGADATRWYMYASAPPYNPRRFAPEHVGEMLRQFMLTLWNTYSFFVTYANLDGWEPSQGSGVRGQGSEQTFPIPDPQSLTPTDRWALARLNQLVADVTNDLENYDIHTPAKRLEAFVEELSNWYVRRNRRRFWKGENDADKHAAYATLYTCLVTLAQLLAPFMPFVSEEMYRNLVAEQDGDAPDSVHLTPWPAVDEARLDEQLLADTATLLRAVTAGRAARKASGIKVRQPLQRLLVRAPSAAQTDGLRRFEDELRDELNVKQVEYLEAGTGLVEYRFKPNLRLVGKKYGKLVPALRAALEDLRGAVAAEAGRRAEAGEPVVVTVDGQTVELLPEELLIETSSPEGFAVAEDGSVLVALDTTLTPELKLEGAARDLVRVIQDTRKEAGFEIADRIKLFLSGDGAGSDGLTLDQVVERHGDYIKGETLAEELHLADAPAEARVTITAVADMPVKVGVVRA